MSKLTLFLIILFSCFLLSIEFSFSQEDNIRIIMRRFAPSLSLSIPQGGSKRLDFFIQNTYNDSLIIFYMIDKPSGVNINYFPPKYYSLEPYKEISGNLNISIDPYLEDRTYTIKFWINSFTETPNGTIRSNEFSIDLNVLKNQDLNTTDMTTTENVESTAYIAPIENESTVVTTEIPRVVPPTWDNEGNISYKEFFMILGVVILLLIIPFLMFRKSFIKEKSSTSSQEGIQA